MKIRTRIALLLVALAGVFATGLAAMKAHEGAEIRVIAAQREAETLVLARRLAQGPTQTFGRIKRLLRESLQRPLRDQLDAERDAFVACAATQDFADGLASFFEKRPAKFIGQ